MDRMAYTHIIVGAGSAGCVLANRLTEDTGNRVMLLEAGGWDRDPHIRIPLLWPRMFLHQRNDWGLFTEPEASMGGRRIEVARGKVIGGSSSTNAMGYVRGHRADYDRWGSAYRLPDWSFDNVLPFFRRQETWEGGADAYRGGEGPLTTQFNRYADPIVGAFIDAGRAAGHPFTPDYNGAQQEGFGRWQSTIRKGRRCSAADAYLRPSLARGRRKLSPARWQHACCSKARAQSASNIFAGVSEALPAAPMTAAPYLGRPYADGFAIRAILLRPESRGRLELASTDPRTPPRIISNFLATDRDAASYVPVCALHAMLVIRRRCGRTSPRKYPRGQTAGRTLPLTPTLRLPASQFTIRLAPAAWVPRTTPMPWSIAICGCAASRVSG